MPEVKQKRDAAATAEQILDSGEKLFAEHGFAHVSVREIASCAAVTKSLIHHHFGSKSDLWNAVKKRAFGTYMDAQITMLSNADGATDGLLRDSIVMYFRYLEANPQLVRIMNWATIEGDTNPVGAALMPLGVARIKEAQKRGRFRADIQPEMALSVFISATTHWFQAQELFNAMLDTADDDLPAAARNDMFIDNFIQIFFSGLLTDNARINSKA